MDKLNMKLLGYSFLTIFFMVIVFQTFFYYVFAEPQTETILSSGDLFEIPSNNSSVIFAANGSYSSAVLENKIWKFQNLKLNTDLGLQQLNLTVSATDCDVIIDAFIIYNRTFGGDYTTLARLGYSIQGTGTQKFNIGLDPNMGRFDAVIDGEFVGRNHGWTISSDGTFYITKPAKSISLLFYGYPESYIDNSNFLEEHYVVIITTTLMLFPIFFGTVIALRKRRVYQLK
jgi:hypothetical protein